MTELRTNHEKLAAEVKAQVGKLESELAAKQKLVDQNIEEIKALKAELVVSKNLNNLELKTELA